MILQAIGRLRIYDTWETHFGKDADNFAYRLHEVLPNVAVDTPAPGLTIVAVLRSGYQIPFPVTREGRVMVY